MAISVRSFAKINVGLCIGPRRDDDFHELRTVYQTIALHDTVRVDVGRGTGIEVRSKDARVPLDESNTCYRIAERTLKTLHTRGRVLITIEKSLPVQAGLGAASSNAVATLLGIERALKMQLPADDRMRIAAEIGSDLPLFLVAGTVLGLGRGEEVYPLPDVAPVPCVVVTADFGLPTPQAFAAWDRLHQDQAEAAPPRPGTRAAKLTEPGGSLTINLFSRRVFAWLSGTATGVPAAGGDRAEALLLDLVRAGIENDFERVVFPQHSELREVKRALERVGARYASLSGSGSAVYGLFRSPAAAARAAAELSASGLMAQATRTLSRREYWQKLFK